MPDYALELFEQFRQRGYARLEEALESDESESPYLDFKEVRTSDGRDILPDGKVHSKIKATLAAAMGAYANTHGGVIVWGIESKNNRDGVKRPFPNFETFNRNLHDAAGSALMPPLDGVDNLAFADRDDKTIGYAVTFVPASARRPHMSVGHDQHRYYMRAGSNSVIMPHEVVRDMMIARSRPELKLEWSVGRRRSGRFIEDTSSRSMASYGDNESQIVIYTIFVRNVGQANAYDVALALEAIGALRMEPGSIVDNHSISVGATFTIDQIDEFKGELWPFRGRGTLYPGLSVEVGRLGIEFRTKSAEGEPIQPPASLHFKYGLFARDFALIDAALIPIGRN